MTQVFKCENAQSSSNVLAFSKTKSSDAIICVKGVYNVSVSGNVD